MALTKAEIIAIFRNTYPACSDADCSRHFDEAHSKILIDLSLHQGAWTTTLTAGVRAYDFDPLLKNVYKVSWLTATDELISSPEDTTARGKTLLPTSVEKMLADGRNYDVDLPTGVPERYWFQSDLDTANSEATLLRIYLDPVPNETSSGLPDLLPRLVAYGTWIVPLEDADEIGDDVPDEYIYVARMKARYAREFKGSQDPDYVTAKAEYDQLLNEAKATIYQRQRLEPPTLQPFFFRRQRRVA